MTNEERAHHLATNYAPEERLALECAILEALEHVFSLGMRHVSLPRGRVSVHGSDACLNCDAGRITIYAASRYCLECQHKNKEKA